MALLRREHETAPLNVLEVGNGAQQFATMA
jgi:hypothetical protein